MKRDFPTSSEPGTARTPGSFASVLLTVSEVAAAMRVSNMTVYRLIKQGELPAVRVGHHYRIRESDLERYLIDRSVHGEGA